MEAVGRPGEMERTTPGPITQLLLRWSEGDGEALDALMPLVYEQLARLAHRYLRLERPDHTLETSALLHETYLRLARQRRVRWHSRSQFFGVSARLMRRVLIDHARRRSIVRRGGGWSRVELRGAAEPATGGPAEELLALDGALRRLEEAHPGLGRLVELRYFGGLTNPEIAAALGVSPPTVVRRWRTARAWLYRDLTSSGSAGGELPARDPAGGTAP